ncbi:hypothetical protein [Methylocystis iwaonis]|uniref:Uncharacterized protein n=1 Tax=Methylocystis iwaonis TaxID=2885079 RepID=A0ABN6VLT4_9HYPH|nr:hypothetical protein [Methylocystis iwaonis]BDV36726.1 hypothetical protein SS37A_42560 [Methylocystis iwaonis]
MSDEVPDLNKELLKRFDMLELLASRALRLIKEKGLSEEWPHTDELTKLLDEIRELEAADFDRMWRQLS